MDSLLGLLGPLVEAYAGKFGVVVQIITYIGTLRMIMKPIMSAINTVVLATPSKSDDEKLKKFEGSKGYKTALYILDWFASLKFKK